jgi:hypothetical protein
MIRSYLFWEPFLSAAELQKEEKYTLVPDMHSAELTSGFSESNRWFWLTDLINQWFINNTLSQK